MSKCMSRATAQGSVLYCIAPQQRTFNTLTGYIRQPSSSQHIRSTSNIHCKYGHNRQAVRIRNQVQTIHVHNVVDSSGCIWPHRHISTHTRQRTAMYTYTQSRMSGINTHRSASTLHSAGGHVDKYTQTDQHRQASTVFALSSAPGKSGVSIIRLSGPFAGDAVEALTRRKRPAPRYAALRKLLHPETAEVLDSALILWFQGPNSFTGEDVAELHVHGGRAVIAGVLAALSDLGLSSAEPGDFSKRAFHNGKLDATEIEGLADLINADTSAQKKLALRQMGGEMRRVCDGLIERMTHSLAAVEAYIDFGEDDLIESEVFEQEKIHVNDLIRDINTHLSIGKRGERTRDGVRVAIVGPPNAGKSSLLNALTRRAASIVSPIPGTTRDVVETLLDLDGFPVVLADTAGIRETTDQIEAEGVRRSIQRIGSCDIRVCVLDGTELNSNHTHSQLALESLEKQHTDGYGEDGRFSTILVVNKTDLMSTDDRSAAVAALQKQFGTTAPISFTSCRTDGADISQLLDSLCEAVKESCESAVTGSLMITQNRHREALMQCVSALERFSGSGDVAIAGEELRLAIRHLGRITGRVSVEEVLDVLFADFCIGK
ncbi:tRNA modification GTPase TrmE [Sphaeroforma arctica JP610]|uniref:tRNA modification GTPase TrmE n=1 Tax=Sphaeroforma arctica JP610 TaxID=667725 RepID=A0A0L0FUQ2_9EUKA|nr:tRNA modification GTPase TrmE [Sphaeroforma arctica JP610]KNC80399.1 tRNA modification GTPase TrmE [Sphaeroforma arctica JP610]|eukprot:XP_014154301.1 tRNA modification GTPase TrmE [Sphaeroforma arctica JP610]